MKQLFIIQEGHPDLLIFFAGWAADETPFKQYRPQGMDYLICYDYSTPDFDTSLLEPYRRVNVVAWSMGVWAAPIALRPIPANKLFSIAFNGSMNPIHDHEGIPEHIFRSTLLHLTPASLQKFMRRMCKDSDAYRAFLQITPRRDFDEIKQELELIEKRCTESRHATTLDGERGHAHPREAPDRDTPFEYDYAIIGKNDRIFPAENLLSAHAYLADDKKIVTGCAHYDEPTFRLLLQEAWSIDTNQFIHRLKGAEAEE